MHRTVSRRLAVPCRFNEVIMNQPFSGSAVAAAVAPRAACAAIVSLCAVPRNIDRHSRGLRKARPVVHPRRPANSARVDERHGVSPWSPRLHAMLVLTAAKVAVAFDGHHTGNALHAPL